MVEIIPKAKQKKEAPARLNNLLFTLFLLVFVLSLVLFFVFLFQTSKYQNQTKEISEQLQSQKQGKEFKELEKKLIVYQDKFNNLAKILGLYFQPSKLFKELIDKTINPQVILKSISFKEKNNEGSIELELAGHAPNKEVLAQQIKIYETMPQIQGVYLKGVKIGKEGNLEFTLSLNIVPEYLTLSK